MANFSIAEYRQAIAGVITGMVLAIFGVDSYRGSVDPRPDPFTGKDGEYLEERILNKCFAYTDLRFKEHSKTMMPPFNARERQIHVEDFIHDVHPEFRRKSNEW